MIIIEAEQRSAAWFEARLGVATASRFKDIVGRTKAGGYAAARNAYMIELAMERITKNQAPRFSNEAMTWGTTQEDAAKEAYELYTFNQVRDVGLILDDELKAGASCDGLLDPNGQIEIKCPYNSLNHFETLVNGMPDQHIPQVQGQLWITGRDFCDFISYDPRMPEGLQLYIQRIERDDEYITTLKQEVVSFLNEVDNQVNKLMALAEERKSK
jgi:putative phage-type endonuclease